MAPKQRLVQNRMLVNQMKDPKLSDAASGCGETAGRGTSSGFVQSTTKVPDIPTAVERAKPAFERSIKYHKKGLARARVRET